MLLVVNEVHQNRSVEERASSHATEGNEIHSPGRQGQEASHLCSSEIKKIDISIFLMYSKFSYMV